MTAFIAVYINVGFNLLDSTLMAVEKLLFGNPFSTAAALLIHHFLVLTVYSVGIIILQMEGPIYFCYVWVHRGDGRIAFLDYNKVDTGQSKAYSSLHLESELVGISVYL